MATPLNPHSDETTIDKLSLSALPDPSAEEKKAASDLIAALTSQEQGVVDFSHDPEMRKNFDKVFYRCPDLFHYTKKHSFHSQEEVAALVSALKTRFNLEESLLPKAAEENLLSEEEGAVDEAAPLSPLEMMREENTKSAPKKPYKDANLALAFLNMQNRVFEINQKRINTLIDQLMHLNAVNRDLADLISKLTACKGSGKADFSKDKEMQAVIDRLYQENPKIFNNQKTYIINGAAQIEILLTALDGEVKTKVAETNQVTMFVNLRFDEQNQFTTNAHTCLERDAKHKESIIAKQTKS